MGAEQGSDSASSERDLVLAALHTAFDAEERPARRQPDVRRRSSHFNPQADSFPGYSVNREIHRGAQGVVYHAVQNGTGREVAIKVIRHGPFAALHETARFEREVQILCQLKHPNIVAIHDSGVVQGHSFLVMDYVESCSLDDHAAGSGRSVRDQLRFFVKICEAVNAAHLQGVIHRDLKPSNILVDKKGEPFVVDFGLAKLGNEPQHDETNAAQITMTGQFIGSLPWASPEQAEGRQAAVDVRSDVYALGVILFRLLTGRFPYDVVGNMREVVANILAATPRRPSGLNPRIDDEVETIILKALSKEPDRRYQSAGELSRDIQRYLHGEPIEAKRASSWYVFRKTVQRHRLPVAAALVFVLVLLGSAIGFSILYRDADRARLAEVVARKTAESEAEKVKQVQSFVHDMLTSADPMQFKGVNLTVREALDAAAANVDTKFAEQPDVELALRNVLGVTYRSLGEYGSAEFHLKRAVQLAEATYATNHPLVLASWHELGELYHYQGRLVEAEQLLSKTIDARRIALGADHPDTFNSMHCRAVVLRAQGNYIEAEAIAREVLAFRRAMLGEDDAFTLDSMNTLAWVLKERGNLAESKPLFAEALELFRKTLGPEHPRSLTAMNNLATVLQDQGERVPAETMYREALELQTRALGEEHPMVLTTMNNLADLLRMQGNLSEAEQFFRTALDARRRVLGNQHQHTLATINNLGLVLQLQKNLAEAEPLYREALAGRRHVLGDEHPDTWTTMSNLASLLSDRGDLEEAVVIQRDVLDLRRRKLGPHHTSTMIAMNNLATVLRQLGQLDESTLLAREAWENAKVALSPQHPNTLAFQGSYAKCLILQKQFDEGESLLLDAYQEFNTALGEKHPHTQRVVKFLVDLYESTGREEEAADFRSRVIEPGK